MDAGLSVVFVAGLATLLTPCILPVIPLYLGMIMGSGLQAVREPGGRARLLTSTVAFVGGFTLVFSAMGLGASTLGGLITEHRDVLMGVGGVLVVLFGLKFLGVLRIGVLDREARMPTVRTGSRILDAALFGVVFALGWTPCVGPILGSVLTYTATRGADPLVGALHLAVYSAGVGLPLVALSLFLDRLLPLLDRARRHLPVMEKVTGGALVALGVVLMGGALLRYLPVEPDDGSGYLTDSGQRVELLGEPSARPRLVELYSEDCPVCQRVRTDVQKLRKDCIGHSIDIHAVNIDRPENKGAARHFSVRAVPTFVLVGEDGRELTRVVGSIALPDLRRAAASLIRTPCAGVSPGDVKDGRSACPGADTPDPTTPPDDFLFAPTCS